MATASASAPSTLVLTRSLGAVKAQRLELLDMRGRRRLEITHDDVNVLLELLVDREHELPATLLVVIEADDLVIQNRLVPSVNIASRELLE